MSSWSRWTLSSRPPTTTQDCVPTAPCTLSRRSTDGCGSGGASPGVRARAALPAVRATVESPKETETRLLIVAACLPEPVVQHEIRRDGMVIARSDLAYPELRIAIEYEGDGHRTDRNQWRRDIQRQRELEDIGWIVIRVTQLDLDDGGRMLLDRIRRAIASRS